MRAVDSSNQKPSCIHKLTLTKSGRAVCSSQGYTLLQVQHLNFHKQASLDVSPCPGMRKVVVTHSVVNQQCFLASIYLAGCIRLEEPAVTISPPLASLTCHHVSASKLFHALGMDAGCRKRISGNLPFQKGGPSDVSVRKLL